MWNDYPLTFRDRNGEPLVIRRGAITAVGCDGVGMRGALLVDGTWLYVEETHQECLLLVWPNDEVADGG